MFSQIELEKSFVEWVTGRELHIEHPIYIYGLHYKTFYPVIWALSVIFILV
jgi:hypothetical protein